MKKVLTIVIVCIMLVVMQSAAFAEPKEVDMPKAGKAPTLDGKIDEKEWQNALIMEMKKDDPNLFVPAGNTETFNGAKFRFMWADEGIYFAAEVNDTTEPASAPAAGSGSYNAGDGVQFNIYTSPEKSGSNVGDLLFFSYHPKTDNGEPAVGEHFVYGNGTAGGDVPEAKIAVTMDGPSYVMEGLIPAEAFSKVNPPLTIESGAKIYMNNVVMEMDEAGTQSLIVDNEWFNGALTNIYTLVDTPAGASGGGAGGAGGNTGVIIGVVVAAVVVVAVIVGIVIAKKRKA